MGGLFAGIASASGRNRERLSTVASGSLGVAREWYAVGVDSGLAQAGVGSRLERGRAAWWWKGGCDVDELLEPSNSLRRARPVAASTVNCEVSVRQKRSC